MITQNEINVLEELANETVNRIVSRKHCTEMILLQIE